METQETSIGLKVIGKSQEAEVWIKDSSLAYTAKEAFLQFVHRFPTLHFFRWEKFKRPFGPAWLQSIRCVLDGIQCKGPLWVQFDIADAFYDIHEIPSSSIWYHKFFDTSPASEYANVFVGEDKLLFVGHWQESDYYLATKMTDSGDHRVHAFNYANIELSGDDSGCVSTRMMRTAFDSYADMFGHIIAVKIAGEIVSGQ